MCYYTEEQFFDVLIIKQLLEKLLAVPFNWPFATCLTTLAAA